MAKRYEQYCPMAHALDLVGDRWALLVVRELMHGPKRYTDLVEHLPGIGTNILAARLRDLEGHGVVARRTLPPPAASKVYELTDYGRELRPALRELALWGARSLGPPTAADELFTDNVARDEPYASRAASAAAIAASHGSLHLERVETTSGTRGTAVVTGDGGELRIDLMLSPHPRGCIQRYTVRQ